MSDPIQSDSPDGAVDLPRLVRLLPCPFCGYDAKMYCETVTCSNPSCKMHFAAVPEMHTPEEWNQRADLRQGEEFRLLSRTDTIQADDEFLTDDCQTWASVGERALRFIVGKPYSEGFFQPMRRRTSLPNAKVEGPAGSAASPKPTNSLL